MLITKFIKISLLQIIVLSVLHLNIGIAQDGRSGTGNQEDKSTSDLPESWVNPPPDKNAPFTVHDFSPSKWAPLVALGPDGRLVYKPYSDMGDRILDWSHCGYKQSEIPIPDVPVVVTLQPLPDDTQPTEKMFYPTGSDNREYIQTALDRVNSRRPATNGIKGAVLLKRGTYYIVGTLKVNSGVVLRGEGDGENGTIMIFNTEGGGDAIVIEGDGPLEYTGKSKSVRITEDYLPSGSMALNVENADQFQKGDYVCVEKTVNQKWIDDLGMGERLRHIRGGKEGAKKSAWKPNSYQFKHIRQIKSVIGNTITLNVVLPQSIDKKHGGGEVYKVNTDNLGTQSGVEFIRVVSNYDKTVQPKDKKTNFRNLRSGIVLKNIGDSWVRNCTMMHFYKSAVTIGNDTQNVTVRNCKSLKPIGPFGGGFRYPYNIGGGTAHLFFECYTEDGRHDFAGGSRTMGPFAFVKCTAVRGGASEPHHRWGTGYLYDCITTDGSIGAFNRGDSGTGHGWSAANTLIWNADAKSVTVFDPETTGENNFAIGYAGEYKKEYFDPVQLWYANTRAGYWGTPQEGKYYGYAIMGSGHIESPGTEIEPASLFVQQLIDRIGKQQAMKVLK